MKWIARIDEPGQAARLTHEAFRQATSGRPGPVVVLCPADVMGKPAAGVIQTEPASRRFPALRPTADGDGVARAARLLADARHPVLIAGGGCILSGAEAQVVALAERYAIPVATTMTGRGTIPDDHPLATGAMGSSTGGRIGLGRIANQLVAEADLVLIAGSRTGQVNYSDWTLPRPGTTVIHLDIDAAEPGRNFLTEVALVGDARETLSVLLDHCLANRLNFRAEDARERIAALKAAWRRDFAPLANSDAVPIKPERLLREISDRVRAETLIVADASYVTGWAYSHIDCVAQGCTIISPRGTGGLSWALPAAIGAKLGDPARNVVCLTGDGGFGYVLSELETAARYQVDLTIVVFNNATLGFQKHFERKLFGTYRECDFLDIDYAEVARAFKCRGERVTEPGAIGAALERAMASGGPALIDVAIDPESKAPVVPLEDDDAIEDTLEAVTQ